MRKAVLVLGYKAHELGVFKDDDPKIPVIKKAITQKVLSYLDEGYDWFVLGGNLGFEFWSYEVLQELKATDYPQINTAVIMPFRTHGQQWNENNQAKLQKLLAADYVEFAYDKYENPIQFRTYNDFLLQNTSACIMFYDEEHETNLKYLYKQIKDRDNYELSQIRFDDLQSLLEDW
jgi:uncharacterized phage-like protein YoqJ